MENITDTAVVKFSLKDGVRFTDEKDLILEISDNLGLNFEDVDVSEIFINGRDESSNVLVLLGLVVKNNTKVYYVSTITVE